MLDFDELCAAFFFLLVERDRDVLLELKPNLFPTLSGEFSFDLVLNMIPVLVSTSKLQNLPLMTHCSCLVAWSLS